MNVKSAVQGALVSIAVLVALKKFAPLSIKKYL